MPSTYRTITIEPSAPAKPHWGAPCNGCGICCLSEPCPVGVLVSRRRQGACAALHWDVARARYRCGAIAEPRLVLRRTLPGAVQALAPVLAPLLAFVARRGIAVGTGCDCDLDVERPADAADAGDGG